MTYVSAKLHLWKFIASPKFAAPTGICPINMAMRVYAVSLDISDSEFVAWYVIYKFKTHYR